MYVCVSRIGGLGNQLFQYAAAKAVADTYGYLLLVEKEGSNGHNSLGHNYATLLMKDAKEVHSLSDSTTTSFYHFIQPGGAFGPWSVQDIPTNPPKPVRLEGYFQYLPPLLSVLPGIRSMLWECLSEQRKCMASQYGLCENGDDTAIVMHIRRGDYTALPHIHFLQDQAYYEKAVSLMKQQTVLKIHVVSDDIEWCKAQPWNFHVDIVFVDEPDELCGLAVMALCRGGAVIANSTFSWWGAVLGNSRHVCYPSRWIRHDTVHDLFPKHWTRVET